MGNRQSSSNRKYHHGNSDIPKASSAPSIYSSNLNLDESPTTIKVASKTSPTHKHKTKFVPSSLPSTPSTSSTSSYKTTNSKSKKDDTTTKSKTDTTPKESTHLRSTASMSSASTISSSSAHNPKSYLNSTNVKSTTTTLTTKTTATSPSSSSTSSVNNVNNVPLSSNSSSNPQQPDNRSGNSTPTGIYHQSSIESITISPRNNSASKLSNPQQQTTEQQIPSVQQPKSSSPPSANKWFMGNEESLSSITKPSTSDLNNESSNNLQVTTKVMHIESVEDFSVIEEPEKEKKELHHSVTLPDITLPSSADFLSQDDASPHPQRPRSNSLVPMKQPVFLAVQNNAHASSRRKLKLAKPQNSLIPDKVQTEMCIDTQKSEPKKEDKTITKQSEETQQQTERSAVVKSEKSKKANMTNLKLEKISKKEEASIDKSDAPLFSPVKSPKVKSPKRKQKGTSPTKVESTNSSFSDDSFSRSSTTYSSTTTSTTPSMAQSLFSSSDERKSFCAAALDFQKNWFNELMGRREQVTFEHSDSLHNPTPSKFTSPYSLFSNNRDQQQVANIFDTSRRHSVFESRNITAVPLIAVSCPPNPAQSLDLALDDKNRTHLSVNAEKKQRIAKKKRNLNNASPKKRSIVSTSCNYSNLSSYKMTSSKK